MAKVDLIQNAFTGGEFGTSLFGRSDLDQYRQAVAYMQNFLVRPYGSAISAPGTMYVNAAKVGAGTTLTGIKLIPFIFSVSDSYVIEMGHQYFRFYTDDAVVTSNGTVAYELAHSYVSTSVSTVQYCQNHDVLYLSHGNYVPNTLVRNSSANWTISALAFTGGPFMPANSSSTTLASSASASGASTTLSASANIFTVSSSTTVGHNGSWWAIGSTITNSSTGLAVQGCVKITTVTNPSTAAATVYQTLTTTAASTNWAEGSWSSVRGYPSSCCFYQGRLFFARTDSEPQTVWGSKTFNFTNFAVDGGADDDAINIQLSATQGNDIKWLTPMNDLICGTYGGEFCITSGLNSGNPLTPTNVQVIQQTSWGSEAIIPKKIGNFCYYVQRGFQKLREIFYLWTSATYKSVDKTILSPQINGGGFLDIAYQQNPDTVLWCLCTNGTLACLTREVDQEVQAWSRIVTAGTFSSLVVIPSQTSNYDEVWVLVQRTINGSQVNYIEVFKNQISPTIQDQCFYVHSGSSYDAYSQTNTPAVNDYSDTTDVVLYLPMNNNFTDSSPSSHVFTNSSVSFSSTIYKYGGFSANFTPNSYINTGDSNDWFFSTGDFTIDFWVNIKDLTNRSPFVVQDVDGNSLWMVNMLNQASGNKLEIYCVSNSTGICTYDTVNQTLGTGTWYHLAFVRQSSNIYIFVNGISQALTGSITIGSSTVFPDFPATLKIGAWVGANNYANAYMDEVRITKGLARWTSNFTPPQILSSSTISLSISATGGSITATSSAAYFTAGNVGNRLRAIDSLRNTVGEMKITGFTSSTVIVGTVSSTFNSLSYSSGFWGVSVTTISGLSYLEAVTVSVNADGGNDDPKKVVSNGTITLAHDYFSIVVGEPYTQTIVTLPPEGGSQRGESTGKIQRINQLALKLNNSYVGFKVGPTSGTLNLFNVRSTNTTGTAPTFATGIIANIPFAGNWKYGPNIVIQNTDPFPIELLNIIQTADTSDK